MHSSHIPGLQQSVPEPPCMCHPSLNVEARFENQPMASCPHMDPHPAHRNCNMAEPIIRERVTRLFCGFLAATGSSFCSHVTLPSSAHTDTAAGLTNDLSVVDLRSTSGAVWHSATLLFTDAAQGAVGQQMLFPKPWDSAIAITPDQRLMLVSSGACMA